MYIITMDKYSSFLFSTTDGGPEFLRGGPLLRGLTCTTKGGDHRTLGLHVEVDSILSYNREDWFFTEQLWPHKHDSIAAMVTCRRRMQDWVCPSKFYPGEGKAHQGILLPAGYWKLMAGRRHVTFCSYSHQHTAYALEITFHRVHALMINAV